MECPLKSDEGANFIVDYAGGKLDPTTRAAFALHVESCANCRDMAAAQREVWTALDELRPEAVSANFDARLLERIAAEERRVWWRLGWAHWSWRPAMPLAGAGAVLVTAFLLRDPTPNIAPPSELQPNLQIEQVQNALDDMDMLKLLGVEGDQN